MLKGLRSCLIAGLLLSGFANLSAFAADAVTPSAAPNENIVQIAVSNPDLSILVKALTDASLVKPLEGAGPFTVFAPTNAAFAKLPTGLLDYLLDNPSILKQVLLYHVASGTDTLTPVPIKTIQGELVFPSFSYGIAGLNVTVGHSTVTLKPIPASNGVIYLIDSVLIPQF